MTSYLLFCHRFFELRFLVVSGLIDHLAQKGKLTLMLPQDLAESFRPYLSENVDIVVADYRGKTGKLKMAAINILGDILYLTFPNLDQLPNATAKFHRDHYTAARATTRAFVKGCSHLASHSRLFRRLCLWLFRKSLPDQAHKALIAQIKPDLMIGCSFGMGLDDAAFLAEAKHNDIRSCVVVQSWDRTSNKGYPTIHSDYTLVWNDIMKQESIIQLEFAPEKVIVTGSPLWDTHFHKMTTAPDQNWRKNLGIDAASKVLFFSCGGFGSHPANMEVIPHIFDLARRQPFGHHVHVVFRMYPQYLSPITKSGAGKEKKDEIEALLAQYKDDKDISILYPEVKFDGKNFMPSEADHDYMTECLRQCDISISQVSSQMIEACLFDKPAINIEFGRRMTDKYDLEIADYLTEHLLRIYRTGAIYRVQKPADLEAVIAAAIENPAEKQAQRQALTDQEAPVHRGDSAKATADTLEKIARRLI